MVQAAFVHLASEIAAVVVGVLAAGGAMMATTRGYIRRTIDSMLDTKVHEEVADQMRPVLVKVDAMCDAQERAEHRQEAGMAEIDGRVRKVDDRVRTIESTSAEVLGLVKAIAKQ